MVGPFHALYQGWVCHKHKKEISQHDKKISQPPAYDKTIKEIEKLPSYEDAIKTLPNQHK